MVVLEGVRATVTVQGAALTEYEDEDQLDRIAHAPFQANRYIEAVSGSQFQIECSLVSSSPQETFGVDGFALDVYVDGTCMQRCK